MNALPKILVAGIGNIFFGDDAFGCEVASELARQTLPDNVRVTDFGIRSYDLAYAMMEDYAATIMVDVVARGGAPGTLYLIEPDLENLTEAGIPDGHSMNPVSVLQLMQSLGGTPRGLHLVGCEPAVLDSEDGRMGLSESVQAAVPHAIEMIKKLIDDFNTVSKTQNSIKPASYVEAI